MTTNLLIRMSKTPRHIGCRTQVAIRAMHLAELPLSRVSAASSLAPSAAGVQVVVQREYERALEDMLAAKDTRIVRWR